MEINWLLVYIVGYVLFFILGTIGYGYRQTQSGKEIKGMGIILLPFMILFWPILIIGFWMVLLLAIGKHIAKKSKPSEGEQE